MGDRDESAIAEFAETTGDLEAVRWACARPGTSAGAGWAGFPGPRQLGPVSEEAVTGRVLVPIWPLRG